MTFNFDQFHYFDKKLLNRLELISNNEDFNEKNKQNLDNSYIIKYIENRKNLLPECSFIVIDSNKIIYIENDLELYVKCEYIEETMHIYLSSDFSVSNKPIYFLQIHNGVSNLHFHNLFKKSYIKIFHEHLIINDSKSSLYFINQSSLEYYHFITNNMNLFHQNVQFNSNENMQVFMMQKKEDSKNKIDTLFNLYEKSLLKFNHLSYIQDKQLRDDAIEVVHHHNASVSHINYFSINGGKSVSQVNSVVHQLANNCETKQYIKHILLDENAQSFSRPNLMIYNPSVIASHGNNIGSFNSEDLFYLKQRGINEQKSKEIISHSYIQKFSDETSAPEFVYTYFKD